MALRGRMCRNSLKVEPLPSKQMVPVQFRLSAPIIISRSGETVSHQVHTLKIEGSTPSSRNQKIDLFLKIRYNIYVIGNKKKIKNKLIILKIDLFLKTCYNIYVKLIRKF